MDIVQPYIHPLCILVLRYLLMPLELVLDDVHETVELIAEKIDLVSLFLCNLLL